MLNIVSLDVDSVDGRLDAFVCSRTSFWRNIQTRMLFLFWLRENPCDIQIFEPVDQAVLLVPRAAVCPQPLQHGKVPALARQTAGILALVAAVRPGPLQHFKVASRRSGGACVSVPIAVVHPRPLYHFKVPACAAALHSRPFHSQLFALNHSEGRHASGTRHR